MGEQQTNDHKKNGKLKNKSDDESVGYNSNIGYNQNQGMNVNGFGNNNGPQPPPANMIKKRNKGINRSRTQPLPDNQNGGGKNNMNMIGNGMNMMPMNMNNGQMMNGGMNNKPIQNTTNFADLNFNAGQQFQSQQHPQSTNFMHGKTTYTSQW